VVAGADEGADRDDAVTAGAIFHHHRLAPPCRQPVRKQPRRDIGAARGAKRHDDADRSRRIGLGGGELRNRRKRGAAGKAQEMAPRNYHRSPHNGSPFPIGNSRLRMPPRRRTSMRAASKPRRAPRCCTLTMSNSPEERGANRKLLATSSLLSSSFSRS